jgi:hypothetical protein
VSAICNYTSSVNPADMLVSGCVVKAALVSACIHAMHLCSLTCREASISDYEASLRALPGDVVLASSFLSYAGPFPSEYRDELVRHTWLPQVSMTHPC